MDADKRMIACFEKDPNFPLPPVSPIAVPQGLDSIDDGVGLILRWQDDNKKWTKEHHIKATAQTLAYWLKPHGQFTSRRYELTMVDKVPCVIVYLEQEPEVLP